MIQKKAYQIPKTHSGDQSTTLALLLAPMPGTLMDIRQIITDNASGINAWIPDLVKH